MTAIDADGVPNYIGALGIRMWGENGNTHGEAELVPEMLVPGTDRVRLGVLATLVDMVGGTPVHAVINPTIDLRITLLDRPPGAGTVHLVCRPLKVGRRLFVGETTLHTGDAARPFATSIVTFMNQPLPGAQLFEWRPRSPLGARSYDESLQVREVADHVLELDNHDVVRNGPAGTIQGGAQALLAELAAERVLASLGDARHEVVATDLDIRYLNRVRTGPVTATAEVLPGQLDGVHVRVAIEEPGDHHRLVALVSLRFQPVARP